MLFSIPNLMMKLKARIAEHANADSNTSFGIRFSIVGISLILASLTMLQPARAQACRDCPFPVKVDETHWLMPNNDVMLNVTEEQQSDGTILMRVSLQDVHTGEIFARGTARRSPGQRDVSVKMRDPKGRRVKAKIRWINFEERVLQADFDCLENRTCANLFGSVEPKGSPLSNPIGSPLSNPIGSPLSKLIEIDELHPIF